MLSAPAIHSACNQTLTILVFFLLQAANVIALCRSEHICDQVALAMQASSMLINHTWTLHGGPVRWYDWFSGPFAQWPYWGILQLKPHTALLFSPFGYIYQPTSPCPTVSAHTEPIRLPMILLEVTSQIVWHIHAIAAWRVLQTLEVWADTKSCWDICLFKD